MRRAQRRAVALAALAFVPACGRLHFAGGDDVILGDDMPVDARRDVPPGSYGDATGWWQLDSFRVHNETGLRMRSDLVNGGRGNLRIDEAASTSLGRDILFGGGAVTLRESGAGVFTSTPRTWTFDLGTSIATYDLTVTDPDHVHLDIDPSAPGSMGTARFDAMDLTRIPLPNVATGTKMVVALTTAAAGNQPAETCVPFMTAFQKIHGQFAIAANYMVDYDFTWNYFDDNQCMSPMSISFENADGAYLDFDGDDYDYWASTLQFGEVHAAGHITFTPASMAFSRPTCEPAASCVKSGTVIELAL